MQGNRSFKLILNSKEFRIPSNVKHLRKIPDEVRDFLFFGQNNQYQVQSNVNESVFQSFIEYWINDTIPDIRKDNINEYIQISQEFNLLKDLIDPKIELWGEYLIHLDGLDIPDNPSLSLHEDHISQNLDYYLENYGELLLNKPIQSLFNIFNSQKKNLTKFNLAYELIKLHSKQSNSSEIFILLQFLNGTKLNDEYVKESLSLLHERGGFIPSIDGSFVVDAIDKQENHEKRIKELEDKLFEYENKFVKEISKFEIMFEKNEENMKMFKQENSNKIEELNKTIQNQKLEIESMKKNQSNEIKLLNETIQKQKKEIESIKNNQINLLNEKIEKQSQEVLLIKKNQSDEIKLLNKTIENEILSLKEKHTNEITSLKKSMKNEISLINGLFKEIFKQKIPSNMLDSNLVFYSGMSIDEPGILNRLKKEEKNKFEPLFVASQSSGDIYNLINPNTNDFFSLAFLNDFVEFELSEKISIKGFKIYSTKSNFPKSFDIKIDNERVKSIKEAKELNGENREMIINIEPKEGRSIRLVCTGKCWDKNSNTINIKKIEVISTNPKYSKGVFTTFIELSKNKDPHYCKVHLSASNFDFNTFYLINPSNYISTSSIENSWFQVALTQGLAILLGFRLKRSDSFKLKKYKLIGTDDDKKGFKDWSTLIEIDEQTTNDHDILDIYKLQTPSPPIRFIRIVQTGKDWANEFGLLFFHFDIFGYYF